ncbi:GntR family transcriptional regulator [Bacillus gobiensis]|uniref:GntR family transcriptional regulator n=1 Tax=Bacillus gobiensis TaxID=1441095 RepID=UPI003D21411F
MYINKHSPVPIYHQIEEQLKAMIDKGELQPDTLLPSEREYSETFGISRMTVRQALSNLVSQGYLYRQKGKGTFVSKQKIKQPLQGLTSFTEDMKSRGRKPSSKLLRFEIIKADEHISNQLSRPYGTSVYEIMRIRLADDIPMALETMYIPIDLLKGLTEADLNASLYEYVEKHLDSLIGHARKELEAGIANAFEASHLDISKGTPVLLMKRISFLQNGTPFEYVKSVYRGDRYSFIFQMDRQK